MSKGFKTFLLIIVIVFLGIPTALMLLFAVAESLNRYQVKTVFGDRFDVDYDDFKDQSLISGSGKRVFFTLDGRITKEDFVPIYHTDDLTIYSVCGIVVFNDSGELKMLKDEDDVDSNPEVAKFVMNNIASDPKLFEWNIRDFLKSKTYANDAEYVVQCINSHQYSSLDEYGINKLKGTNALDRISNEAWQIKLWREREQENRNLTEHSSVKQ